MGQTAEALLAWKHCLALNPHFHPSRKEMEKVSGTVVGSCALTSPMSSEGLMSVMVVLLWVGSRDIGSWSKSLPIAPMQVYPCKLPFLSPYLQVSGFAGFRC